MSGLQDHPHLLEAAYDATHGLLRPFRRWLKPGGVAEKIFVEGEIITKGPLFDCRMCGQCVLHSTGMTCPMTCPKNLRNGPCGGVRPNGHCEVKPEMRCVWLKGYERADHMPGLPETWREEFNHMRPPVDNRLKNTSSWANFASKRDRQTPAGWQLWDEE